MLLISGTVLAVAFHDWVIAELVHICAEVWRVLVDLDMLVNIRIDTSLEQVGKL